MNVHEQLDEQLDDEQLDEELDEEQLDEQLDEEQLLELEEEYDEVRTGLWTTIELSADAKTEVRTASNPSWVRVSLKSTMSAL